MDHPYTDKRKRQTRCGRLTERMSSCLAPHFFCSTVHEVLNAVIRCVYSKHRSLEKENTRPHTTRGALGWYRPSVGVPRDVGCCALVVFVAYIFSVQFSIRRHQSSPAQQRQRLHTSRASLGEREIAAGRLGKASIGSNAAVPIVHPTGPPHTTLSHVH